MSHCKFSSGKPFEGGSSCLKQTTARKKSRLLSRSLAFISIFCVLALLFTSFTPVVFADEMFPAPEGSETPEQPDTPADPEVPETPEQPETPADPEVPETPEQPEPPAVPETPEQPNPENLNATLVFYEVVAGATEISGKIETEEALPPYDLILEIIDKDGVTHTAELKADPAAPVVDPEWKIDLPEDYPSLQPGDQITITIKIPGTDWELSESAEVQSTQSGDSELDISDVNIPVPVGGEVKAPTINPVFYDATTISGGNLAKAKINKKNVIATVHVSLKDSSGTEKAACEVTPKSGTTWKVALPEGVKVEEGDEVTVYQQIGEDKSPEVTAKAQPSKASTVTLTMPSGEIWIEQTSSNIVNTDEQAEAVELFNNVNTAIAGDISKVEFSIDGTEHAYYEVTYTDKSTSGKIEAPNLKIKQVTETSRSPEIGSITVVDNVVKGKLAGPGPFDGIKVQLVINVKKEKADQYCNENKCTVDKDSSKPVEVTLQDDGTFSYTLQAGDSLTLDQIVGVSVKEPHKFVSCSTTTVKPVTVEKTEVRDPRKLTAEDKKAIDAAIRTAYTVNGESKLPNGTGDWDGVPAVIQFDDSGNVKIFSGNDAKGNFDPNNDYKFVPETNDDGSVKVNDGAQPVITIPAKDLLKNIAPKSPAIAVDTDNGKVTITPPAYENPGDDTDLASYTVSYKDASGAEKTVTATRTVDEASGKTTWTADNATVDANTGVITLSVEDVELAGTITATAKDNGGLEGDTDKLDSDPATQQLETATVSYNGNGGTGNMDSKTLNKGSKYKILDNTFKAPDENQEFKAWEVDGKEVAAGTEITVTKDTGVKAVWKTLQVKVSYDANGGSGDMESATVDKGSEYTVLPNAFKAPDDTQEFDTWEVNGQKVAPGTKIKPDKDTVIKAIWKKIPVKVTYDANGGSGEMEPATVDKGSEYTVLPNAFKAPDDTQEFDTWEVNGQKVAPGTKIKADKDTVIKAIWKKIPVKVTYDANGGSGEMESATVDKGSEYTVLPNAFKAPDDTQEFDTWEVNGQKVAAGTKIKADKDTVIKAIWKKIPVKISYDSNGGSGEMKPETVDKGSEYTVLPNAFKAPDDTQEFDTWEVNGQKVAAGTKIKADKDTVIKAIWKKIPVKVSYDANGGSGEMESATVDKGSEYTVLPNAFKAPDDTQEFDTWEVNGQKVAPGTKIKADKDTVIKAIWKKIPVKISYDSNGGSGEMKPETVDKGSEYTVLPNAFKAPDDTKEFDTWEVNGEKVAPGTKIKADKDTVITAIWKDIMVKIIFDPNGGNWGGDTALDEKEYPKGKEIDIKEAPTRDGYKFLYWKGSEYQPGDKYTANEDHTFVAQWEPNPVESPVIGRINPRDIPPKYVVTPQGSMQPAPSPSAPRVYKTLPRTGESNGLPFLASALLALLGGALILSRKRS